MDWRDECDSVEPVRLIPQLLRARAERSFPAPCIESPNWGHSRRVPLDVAIVRAGLIGQGSRPIDTRNDLQRPSQRCADPSRTTFEASEKHSRALRSLMVLDTDHPEPYRSEEKNDGEEDSRSLRTSSGTGYQDL